MALTFASMALADVCEDSDIFKLTFGDRFEDPQNVTKLDRNMEHNA